MRYNRTFKKHSVTELFNRTQAPDPSGQLLGNPDGACSRSVFPSWSGNKRGQRTSGALKPCSVLVTRLSDEGIAKILRGSGPRRASTLHDKSGANGLSRDLKAQLAVSTGKRGECNGPVQNQVKAGCDPPKIKCSKEMSNVKEATKLKGVSVPAELGVGCVEQDKSEELADIINFLIETDPKRSKEVPISLAAKAPVIKEKTTEAECPKKVQKPSSTSRTPGTANSEEGPNSVTDSTCRVAASENDAVIQSRALSPEKCLHLREVEDRPASAEKTASNLNDGAVERQTTSPVVPQLSSDGSRIGSISTVNIVLPARCIYDFTYEPHLNARSVSRLSSQDTVLGACQAVKAKSPSQQAKVISESAAMGILDSPKETSLSAGNHASDQNRKPEDLKTSAKDEAAYSSSNETAIKASSEPPKTMVSDTLRPSGILDETSESRTNSSGARLAIEDKNDACPDTDKVATLSPPTYHDTRSRREEDDSCRGVRRNDEALGDDQLRTAARPDVDTKLDWAPDASVPQNKAGSDLKYASLETVCPVERNTSSPVPEEDASIQKDSVSEGELGPEAAIRKESDVESDDTEVEWELCTALTPCNSPENSRESGFKEDQEDTDAGIRSKIDGFQHELSSIGSKDGSGIPDGKVMSDDAVDDEAVTSEAVETRLKALKQPTLISVFTKVQEGKIVSVDCKKFRKRNRSCWSMSSPSKKKLMSAKERLTNGSVNRNADEEDVDKIVGEVLRDVIEKTVIGSSGLLSEKLSTENLKDVFQTFCANNGYRYQDFVSDEAGLNFDSLLGQQPSPEMQDSGMKKRRRGSSDHGSSSDHGPEVTPRTTRKRRKGSTPVPEKRILTRSQWRRTCNGKSFEEAACKDGTKNGDEPPNARRVQVSAEASLELENSNTESSIDSSSAHVSREMASLLRKRGHSTSPGPDRQAASISSSTTSAGQINSVQSSEPPELSYMEASVTSGLSELGHALNRGSARSPDRTETFPDLDVSDQEEDRLVICDSEDTQQPVSPATCHSDSDSARAPESREQQCGAARSPSLVVEATARDVPPAVPPAEPQQSAKESPVRDLCESEEAAENTSVVCQRVARADSDHTTSLGDVSASAAVLGLRSESTLPEKVANDGDSKNLGVTSASKTLSASKTSTDDKALELVVIKEELVTPTPINHSQCGSSPQGSSEEPLDLSVKELTFRPRADIPVGKVHPQMAFAHTPVQTNDSPINYSSKSGALEKNVVGAKLEVKHSTADAKNHGSQSATRSPGTKEDPGSDSILQRLLLDPNRKPKEPETENPMPVSLDVRSFHGLSDSPKDTGKRGRDSDIVAEAKSLLSARLAAKQQSSAVHVPKGSTVASVPPMSFPENKLGMTTLETKILELKKQIHHLTILATYKEKELACISSLRTAKEDALKQLEHKYPAICSVMKDFGSDSATSEHSSSPGMTDVPSIVTQAATATSLSPACASDSEPPLQKKLAVQPPLIPAPRLRIGIPEHESSRRPPLSYEGVHSSTPPALAPHEGKQPAETSVASAAPAKSAFCVPSATLQGSRTQRLLLPKAPVPQHPVNTAVNSSPRLKTSALASPAASMANWWNGPNGSISPTEQPSSLSHHLRKESLREYASPSSPQFQSVSSLSPVMTQQQQQQQQQQGGAPQRQSSGDASARPSHRRARDSSLSITEGSRDMSSGVARHLDDFGLSLSQASAVSGQGATAYAFNRANLAATNIYNQAMAYSLYQQLRLNKEASSAAQAEAAANSAILMEKMKQSLPPSQQHLYQQSLGSLLEQAKGRPTAWDHFNLLLQKGTMDVSAAELPWAQSGLVCLNCGDPRVKFVCSCCRTQTFCSEQCQIKLWNKQKSQTSTKH